MLRLTRLWISNDPDAVAWLVRLHGRGRAYARTQLWQVRKELAGIVRSELRSKEPTDRPTWARFDTDTLLGVVLHAAARLAEARRESFAEAPPEPQDPPDDQTRAPKAPTRAVR